MTDSSVEAVESIKAALCSNLRIEPVPNRMYDWRIEAESIDEAAEATLAAIAALPPPEREPMRWQPIESAPKDGSRVLLQPSDHREMPFIGFWSHVGRYTSSPQMWIGHEYGPVDTGDLTHWMPLPAPPPAQSGDRT